MKEGPAMEEKIQRFEKLLTPVYNKLFRYIYSIVRNKAMADDAMQNTLFNAYTHLDDLKDEAKFTCWIYTIGRRESINLLRHYSRELSADYINQDMYCDDDPVNLDDAVMSNEVKEVLIDIINNKLSNEDRAIIILRYYGELQFQEISAVLHINCNTVRTRHKHIKKKIYNYLNEMGLI